MRPKGQMVLNPLCFWDELAERTQCASPHFSETTFFDDFLRLLSFYPRNLTIFASETRFLGPIWRLFPFYLTLFGPVLPYMTISMPFDLYDPFCPISPDMTLFGPKRPLFPHMPFLGTLVPKSPDFPKSPWFLVLATFWPTFQDPQLLDLQICSFCPYLQICPFLLWNDPLFGSMGPSFWDLLST